MPVTILSHILGAPATEKMVQRFSPQAAFAPVIDGFLFVPAGAWPRQAVAFSDGLPTLVFTMKAGTVSVCDNGAIRQLHAAWLNSPYLENIFIGQAQQAEDLLIARFRPSCFYKLFRVPAPGNGDRYCRELPAALGKLGADLLSQVQRCDTLAGKIGAIEAFVAAQPEQYRQGNAFLERAISTVEQNKGKMSVQALSSGLNISSKWLERHFVSHLGLSPKEYIRQRRFLYTCLDLSGAGHADLGALALEHGYCDQNHLTKDFRRFTGKAPLQYWKSSR